MLPTRPPIQPTGSLWSSLAQYYRSCLEREQLLRIQVAAAGAHYVQLRAIDEHLITQKAVTTILTNPAHTLPVLSYLNRRGRGIGGTFIYGYPLVRDGDALIPLCYTEVSLEPGTAPQTVVLHRGTSDLLVNRHFLVHRAGLSHAEVDDLVLALRSPKGKGPKGVVDDFLLEVDVIYDAILFGAENTGSAGSVARELHLMEQMQRHHLSPAMRVFVGEQANPALQPAETVTILPSDPSQTRALLRRGAPVQVVAGPPGSGKTRTAINLMAGALCAGQSILYISRRKAAVEAVQQALTQDQLFPGVMRIGSREALASSLGHAGKTVELAREFRYDAEDADALAVRSRFLADEVARLDGEVQQVQRLQTEEREMSILAQRVEESLHQHPMLPAIQVLAGQVVPANAGQFKTDQLIAVRQLLARTTGEAEEPSSFSSRLFSNLGVADRLRSAQIQKSLRQIGLPEFCIAEGERQEQVEALMLLEQAFPLLLARARGLHAQHLLTQYPSLPELQAALMAAQEEKVTVDRKRLHAAWLRVADQIRPNCDQLLTLLAQEEQALAGSTKDRAGRRQRFIELLKSFPVTLSETSQVAGTIPNEPELFDLVIIDDANEIELPSFLPLLYRARRICVLGDEAGPKHLPSLGELDDSRLLDMVQGRNLAAFAYTEVSALERAAAAVGRDSLVQLTRQYRSLPAIFDWAAEQFYDDTVAAVRQAETGTCGFQVEDVAGQTLYPAPGAPSQAQNPAEVQRIVRLLTDYLDQGITSISILTPFRGQALLMARLLERLAEMESDPARAQALRDVEVATLREVDPEPRQVVLLSTVVDATADDRVIDWVEHHRRLFNQAVTHATDRLVVVGHRTALAAAGGVLGSLVAHAEGLTAPGDDLAPIPPGLQPERLGLGHGQRSLLRSFLVLPESISDGYREDERELVRRLSKLLPHDRVLLASRLCLLEVVSPGVLAELSPADAAAAARSQLMVTLVNAQTLRPIAAAEIETGDAALGLKQRICQRAGLPLVRVRPGQWPTAQTVASLVPKH